VVVVVAEDGDDGQVEGADRPADELGLVRLAAAAEIAGEQQQVGVVLGAADAVGEGVDVVVAEVDVADGGDADGSSRHVMRSVVWRSVGSATETSLWTRRPSAASAATVATASKRSALVTVPDT
jgi:hypothetical protein